MRIRIVDAFTERPFAGNPAGVMVMDDGFPDDRWMQDVAGEVNLAETAFTHPLPDDPDADWALRWFTPKVEVDLCGHATLATAHVLYTTGLADDAVRFRTRSGVLTVYPGITMDFPAATVTECAEPAGLTAVLGAPAVSTHSTGAVGDLVVELADETTVRRLTPDVAALAGYDYRAVIVTARAGEPDAEYDFVSRVFAPTVGIPEDPVTGSAHTALAPFWSARLGDSAVVGYQASARGGNVRTVVVGDRVRLSGSAVTVIDGELYALPPA